MEQMSIFTKESDFSDKKVRLIELFAGIGAQAAALEKLNVDFEHYKISEWEVSATRSYNAVHISDWNDYSSDLKAEDLPGILFKIGISNDGKNQLTEDKIRKKGEKWQRRVYNDFKATNNIGSILNRKGADLEIVETDKYIYIMTYSFPCQDLSVAGKMRGMKRDAGTRSGLLWEVERLLNELEELPQILLMENVTQVHSTKNKEDFDSWLNFLSSKGYVNFVEDLNATDYGIPQRRIRTFVVSILRGSPADFVFPEKTQLQETIKDYLEEDAAERYYIKSEKATELIENLLEEGVIFNDEGQQSPEVKKLGNYYGKTGGNFAGTVFDTSGVSPTISAASGGNTQPIIVAQRGRYIEGDSGETRQRLEPNLSGTSNALTTVDKDNLVLERGGTLGSGTFDSERNGNGICEEIGRRRHIVSAGS